MKVRTKLALLLAVVLLTFVAGLLVMKTYERRRFLRFSAAREEERSRAFDEFLQQWSEPLNTFVQDFSAWSSLVTALQGDAESWAAANLTDTTLASYHAHAVWIYHPDATLAVTRNLLYTDSLREAPLPPGGVPTVLDQMHRCHFFAWTSQGLMEINGATVHPSDDSQHRQPARGYFFAGRLWSNADLREMSLLAGNKLQIEKPADESADSSRAAAGPGARFTRPLRGWDGTLVATLVVRNESAVVQLLTSSSERLFLGTIVFAAVLFFILLSSLTRWFSRPLKALSDGLRAQDSARLERLQTKGDEFGDLARLMKDFFAQRSNLLREMAERRHAQDALHESEERLRHSQKMEAVGRLAGGVAHDFNNLLTAIIGYAELISTRTRESATREEALLISQAGERAADLTRQLLAFSRKQILQPCVLELNDLVRNLQKLLGRIIGEKINLRFEAAPGLSRVYADPAQVEQVVLNLGVNARDAMPRGGTLTMSIARRQMSEMMSFTAGTLPPGEYVALTVQDTGCGMNAETQARIFEPFFTTKGPGKGTGLGLATVYGIVQQSGGAVLVRSALGEGSTFTVFLPYVEAPLQPAEAPPPPLESSAPTATVLVVEDECIVSELVCAVLSAQGLTVLCASNGLEGLALAHAHEGPIDLLLSDVIMPQMTGPEIARELQVTRPEMKVLFVSGYSEADISDDGVLSPGINWLPKPFTPEVLIRRVREILEQPAVELAREAASQEA